MVEENKTSQIKSGMILSYLNIFIGNLIPFFYTPIMLSLLGQKEYGLYKIATSTTSYLSLMAFGIGGAITRYLIKARREEGKETEENIFGLFHLMFQAISILTIIVGLALAFNIDFFYGKSLSTYELSRMKILIVIIVINTAVGFSASSYNAVASAHERFIFIQIINIILTTGTPLLNLLFLLLGYKSIAMVSVSLALNVVCRIIYIIYVRKFIKIRPKFNNMPIYLIKEIITFSFWIFVSEIVGQLYNATDTVIIGMIPRLATVGVSIYSIGYTFNNMMFSIAQVTPSLFTPKINKMVFSGCSNDELTEWMIRVGRLQGYTVTLACSLFIVFGQPFIHFYAGEGYEQAYWVAILVMIPNCIPLVQSVAHSVLVAKNMHKFRSKVYLVMASINVVLTAILVNKLGIIGATIPTGLCYIFGNGFVMNWYYWKKVGLDIPKFWNKMKSVFFIPIGMCLIALLISKYVDFYNLWTLFIGIITYTIIYIILSWNISMTSNEKNIIMEPIRKIRTKVGGA